MDANPYEVGGEAAVHPGGDVVEQKWSNEQIGDFVRKLGFLDAEGSDGDKINQFLHLNQVCVFVWCVAMYTYMCVCVCVCVVCLCVCIIGCESTLCVCVVCLCVCIIGCESTLAGEACVHYHLTVPITQLVLFMMELDSSSMCQLGNFILFSLEVTLSL